ncbi:MAG: UDP-N-acetylmuramoyl-tripeptide--D-alanyl-D-alanine ligase [Pyrinomonadaceae bacterium]|nr:UDP-N-acetylmuramoyl-tripeptide--D-alanyl-D-alanine ligase [Pyrinomonadaceae bacterium]
MNIAKAASLMRARMVSTDAGGGELLGREIAGYAIDSRRLAPDELFFALSPEDYARHCFTGKFGEDAHRFVPQALKSGAVAVVARATRVEADPGLLALGNSLLLVEDCIEALQHLAHGVLREWGKTVIEITGSAGKTTTKDLTSHVLQAAGRRVLRSQKNFNSELGLPLSVLQMESAGRSPAQYDTAVLEMGMSMAGELTQLCHIAPPDIAVELSVLPVHLEFLGTIENIAAAKSELIKGLKPGGTAILNADDERVAAMREMHAGPVLTFGLETQADVMATEIEGVRLGLTRFRLHTPLGEAVAELPMPGRHNLSNALAAAAVATCFEIAPAVIGRALREATVSEMRGQVLKFADGFTAVDDTYNSNPGALLGMVRTVTEGVPTRDRTAERTIVIAGEMLELGPESAALHRETGSEIARLKVDQLWGIRGHARELVEGAREAGMDAGRIKFFETVEEAAAALRSEVREGDLILVKGSRGVRTDKVIEALRERFALAGGSEQGM